MKSKLIFLIFMTALMYTACFAHTSAFDIRWWDTQTYSNLPGNTLKQWAEGMEGRIGDDVGTGTIYYVDSGVSSEGDGSSWTNAKDTIEEAYDLCSANVGDVVKVAPGHAETLGTLVLDTEGVSIIGVGSGEDRPEITFDGTGDIITISAASNTLKNLSFRAGVSAITTGINITGDGDYTVIWDCDFPEPADSSYEFTTGIQLTTGSDYVTVAYCSYKNADATGAAEFIDGGAGVVNGLSVVGNYIYGEFSVAAVHSDQTDLELLIANNVITNMTSNLYAIKLGASATGWLVNNKIATDTYATGLEAGGLAVDEGTTWVDYGQTDIVGVPYFTPADGISQLNATTVAAISSAVDALSGIGMIGTCTENSTTTTVISSDLSGYVNDTFNEGWSLVCIKDNGGTVGTLPSGEIRDVTDYASDSGTFTTAAWTEALTTSDEVLLIKTEYLNHLGATMAGSSAKNIPVLYVDDGGSNGEGTSWQSAKTTIAAAETIAVAGQVIYVGASHNEAIGSLVVDVAGLKIIGMGQGDTRPILDYDLATDEITINAAGVTFKNFRLMPGATEVAAGIVLGANGDGCLIENIAFIDGEGDDEEFIDGIVYNTATTDTVVRGCTYENSKITAGETDTFVNLDAATIANATVEDCRIFGDFSEAPIWWGGAVPTNLLVKDNILSNTNTGEGCIEGSGAATGMCVGNRLYADDFTYILDPGYMKCFDNWAADAVDQQAIRVPISGDSSDVSEDDDGSDLERIEYLQNQVADILAGIRMAGGSVGDVYYCDDGGSGGDGTTWATAEKTLDAAVSDCSANVGDIVFVAPAHDEVLAAAQVVCDMAGVTIIGIGKGSEQPQIEMQHGNSSVDVTAAGVTIKNINFYSSTAFTAIAIDVDAANFTLEDCLFNDVGDFEFVIAVDLNGDAEYTTIRNCRFETVDGTTGATSCIAITDDVIAGLLIEDCYIWGDFDNAGIYSDQVNTGALIRNNVVYNAETTDGAIEFSDATTGVCVGNTMGGDTMTALLDPGSMLCSNNFGVDAINQQAIALPISAETSDVTEVADGSNLERLELLQNMANDAIGLLGAGSAGKIVYVDSGETSSTEDGLTWATAHDTVDEAIEDCGDNTGDIILVAAGHAETATTGGLDIDTPGITIIGLGNGDQRPTITYDTGADTCLFGADGDNSTIKNFRFVASVDSVVTAIQVEAACLNWTIENCEFSAEDDNIDEFDDVILASGAASHGGVIKNCRFLGTQETNADPQSAINFADINDIHIIGNEIYGDRAVACIENSAAADRVLIKDNILFNGIIGGSAGLNSEPCIELNASTSGTINDNQIACNVALPELSIVAADCFLFGNTYNETESSNGAQPIGLRAGQTYVLSKEAVLTGTTEDLFLVANGPILITSFIGSCTTIFASPGDTTIELDSADDDFDGDFSTTVSTDAVAEGDIIYFTAVGTEGVLTIGANDYAGEQLAWFCTDGTIEQTTTSGSQTGAITWYMTFIPLANGCTVTPQ